MSCLGTLLLPFSLLPTHNPSWHKIAIVQVSKHFEHVYYFSTTHWPGMEGTDSPDSLASRFSPAQIQDPTSAPAPSAPAPSISQAHPWAWPLSSPIPREVPGAQSWGCPMGWPQPPHSWLGWWHEIWLPFRANPQRWCFHSSCKSTEWKT